MTHESPGLNPHWLWEISSFSVKNSTFCYRLVLLVSWHKQAAMKSDDGFLLVVCYFFMNWDISFFPFDEKLFPILNARFCSEGYSLSSKGFKIEAPQIFNVLLLIMSKPWASFALKFLTIFAISSLLNEIVERLFVLLKESGESLLVFSTSAHC